MKTVGQHPNVLSFLGCWTTTKPLYLIIEYIPHGDLLQWLRRKRSQVCLIHLHKLNNPLCFPTSRNVSQFLILGNEKFIIDF